MGGEISNSQALKQSCIWRPLPAPRSLLPEPLQILVIHPKLLPSIHPHPLRTPGIYFLPCTKSEVTGLVVVYLLKFFKHLPTVASFCVHHHSMVFVNSLDLSASWILIHPGLGCQPVEWDYSEAVGTCEKKLGNWGVLWRVYQNISPDSFCLLPVHQVKGITVGCVPCHDALSLSQAQRQHGWTRDTETSETMSQTKPFFLYLRYPPPPGDTKLMQPTQEGLPVNVISLPNSHRKPY